MANEEKEQSELKEEKQEQVLKDKVELDAEQYNALLDRLAELESLVYKREQKQVTLDDLVEEGRSSRREVEESLPSVDWEDLSGKELYQKVMGEVNRVGQQLLTEIQTLKVLREIDKCEGKYEDFWDYRDEIQEIAVKNPSLSIEQAYKLAKASVEEKKARTAPKEGEAKEPLSQKLLRLPPRVTPGEKPGVAPRSTKGEEVKTLRDAALKAWEEVVGKGKSEI